MTNRHIAQPWIADDRAQSISGGLNAQPRLKKLIAYFPDFFFSRRRRYTTWTGDWSSDVCSSDLGLPSGFLGVDIFFVLSGFLITDLLVASYDRTGRLDLAGFWTRRARRLLPALAVMLVVVTEIGRASCRESVSS